MNWNPRSRVVLRIVLTAPVLYASLAFGQSQNQPPRPAASRADEMLERWNDIGNKLIAIAQDFPEDKYDFKLKPEMRTFAAVMVHIASGNVYAAKAGRGENVNWDELDPKDYANKAAVVALMEKSIADAQATLKSVPDAALSKSVEPWISVIEHSAEHYGLLVAYYRANGLVPPESRPKK